VEASGLDVGEAVHIEVEAGNEGGTFRVEDDASGAQHSFMSVQQLWIWVQKMWKPC